MKFGASVSFMTGNVIVGRLNKKENLFLEKEEMSKNHSIEMAIKILKAQMTKGHEAIEFINSTEKIIFSVKPVKKGKKK